MFVDDDDYGLYRGASAAIIVYDVTDRVRNMITTEGWSGEVGFIKYNPNVLLSNYYWIDFDGGRDDIALHSTQFCSLWVSVSFLHISGVLSERLQLEERYGHLYT